jgi:hypothetical protein
MKSFARVASLFLAIVYTMGSIAAAARIIKAEHIEPEHVVLLVVYCVASAYFLDNMFGIYVKYFKLTNHE